MDFFSFFPLSLFFPQLLDLGFDGSEVEPEGNVLAETEEATYENDSRQSFHVFFEEPVALAAQRFVF